MEGWSLLAVIETFMNFVFGGLGILALFRVKKLIKTLKGKGILGHNHKEK
ncbi:MAG: hypothetical protein ACJ0A6_02910 [Dehalococcoidia bacterium]